MTAVIPGLPPGPVVPERRNRAGTRVGSRTGTRVGIRVAAVPAGHVYVRDPAQHLAAPTLRAPARHLPDPCPRGTPRSRWDRWPPAMPAPDWVHRHHDEFDVFHLHQGYENASPDRLTELARLPRRLGKPLVFTVHDPENPYEAAPSGHLTRLDVLAGTVTDLARRAAERQGPALCHCGVHRALLAR